MTSFEFLLKEFQFLIILSHRYGMVWYGKPYTWFICSVVCYVGWVVFFSLPLAHDIFVEPSNLLVSLSSSSIAMTSTTDRHTDTHTISFSLSNLCAKIMPLHSFSHSNYDLARFSVFCCCFFFHLKLHTYISCISFPVFLANSFSFVRSFIHLDLFAFILLFCEQAR